MTTFYKKNGWEDVKNCIPQKLLKNFRKDLDNIAKSNKYNNFNSLIVNLSKKNKNKLRDINILSNRLTSFLEICVYLKKFYKKYYKKSNVYLIDAQLLPGLPKDNRLTYDYHQESNYKKNFKNILNIHFPVYFKSTKENGTMSSLTGTHLLGNLNYKKRERKQGFTHLLPENIDKIKSQYNEKFHVLNCGDAVFFDQNLIHKSNYNYSSKCRICCVVRITGDHSGNFIDQKPTQL